MSIEEVIFSATSSLFSGRVFPDWSLPGTARPFMVYSQVGGVPSNTVCGNTTAQNHRIQFTIWCDAAGGGRPMANGLMRQVESIITSSPIYGVSLGGLQAMFDEMTKTYGAMQDFSIWHVDESAYTLLTENGYTLTTEDGRLIVQD